MPECPFIEPIAKSQCPRYAYHIFPLKPISAKELTNVKVQAMWNYDLDEP